MITSLIGHYNWINTIWSGLPLWPVRVPLRGWCQGRPKKKTLVGKFEKVDRSCNAGPGHHSQDRLSNEFCQPLHFSVTFFPSTMNRLSVGTSQGMYVMYKNIDFKVIQTMLQCKSSWCKRLRELNGVRVLDFLYYLWTVWLQFKSKHNLKMQCGMFSCCMHKLCGIKTNLTCQKYCTDASQACWRYVN